MPIKRVHAELIKAWADGAEIEVKDAFSEEWVHQHAPSWSHLNQYRIRDPYAELKAAAADPTKQIRFIANNVGAYWEDAGHRWTWCYPPENYEIRDKPKAKVKMWQWVIRDIDGKTTYLSPSFHKDPPELDGVIQCADWTEIEVDV